LILTFLKEMLFSFVAEVLWPRKNCDGKYRGADKLLAR
jgi:hypothetical protein